MRWASALSERKDALEALHEVLAALTRDLDGAEPDLLFLFVSPHHHRAYRELPPICLHYFSKARLIGCSGGGIIGDNREIEHKTAISVTAAALPGVTVTPFRLGTREDLFPTKNVQALVPKASDDGTEAGNGHGNGHGSDGPAATKNASGPCFVLLPEL